MVRRIEMRTGMEGYRSQLDRTRRFYDRVTKKPEGTPYIIDYQDDVWSFFMHCWHLKDWIKRDPLVPDDMKTRIRAAVHESKVLAVANDLATAAKHVEVYESRAGAEHAFLRLDHSSGVSTLDYIVTVNGEQRSSRQLAGHCMREWERILQAEGLPIEPMGS